jgi:Trp operon repressor
MISMPFKSNENLVEELKPKKTPRKVIIRRANLRMILMRGYHTREELVKRLNVSSATISRDMEVVQKELEEELKKEDMIKLLNDFKLQNQGAYEEAWKLFEKTKHPNAKIGALRLIHDFQNDKIKILQSLGIIREVAPLERRAIEISFVRPEWLKTKPPESDKNGSNEPGTNGTDKNNIELPPVEPAGEVSQ